MKVLTLTQPWATLVAIGAKKIETRSWGTRYRGPLAIHAAKGFPAEGKVFANHEPFSVLLAAAGYKHFSELPLGQIVAVGVLYDCKPVEIVRPHLNGIDGPLCGAYEVMFGDYTPGRFAWLLKDVRRLETPVLARGSLGLWEIDDALLSEVIPR